MGVYIGIIAALTETDIVNDTQTTCIQLIDDSQ